MANTDSNPQRRRRNERGALFLATHRNSLESAMGSAITQTIAECAADPLARYIELLQKHHGSQLAARNAAPMDERTHAGGEWTVEGFVASLPVPSAVADALRHKSSVPAGGEFEFVRSFTSEAAIVERLREGQLVESVAKEVWAGTQKLQGAKAASGAELNAKFAADGDAFKGEMGFGGTDEFYAGATLPRTMPRLPALARRAGLSRAALRRTAGLEGIIGGPLMVEGSLLKAMEAEHCTSEDSKQPFDTSNGITGVTSATEWEFVVEPNAAPEHYAERGGNFRAEHPDWCRKPLALSVFEEKVQHKNAELREAKQAEVELIKEELVGGRLCAAPSPSGSPLVHPPPLCTAARAPLLCAPHTLGSP